MKINSIPLFIGGALICIASSFSKNNEIVWSIGVALVTLGWAVEGKK